MWHQVIPLAVSSWPWIDLPSPTFSSYVFISFMWFPPPKLPNVIFVHLMCDPESPCGDIWILLINIEEVMLFNLLWNNFKSFGHLLLTYVFIDFWCFLRCSGQESCFICRYCIHFLWNMVYLFALFILCWWIVFMWIEMNFSISSIVACFPPPLILENSLYWEVIVHVTLTCSKSALFKFASSWLCYIKSIKGPSLSPLDNHFSSTVC